MNKIVMVIIGILSLLILYKIIHGGLVEGAEDTPQKNVNCSNIILSNDKYNMCEKMSKKNNNRVCVDNDTKVCSGVTLKKNESCETKSYKQTTCNIDDIPKPNQKPAGENTDAIDKACSPDGGSLEECEKYCKNGDKKNKKYCCLIAKDNSSDGHAARGWCYNSCKNGDLDQETCCGLAATWTDDFGGDPYHYCIGWNTGKCEEGSKYEECCDFPDNGGNTIKLGNNMNRCLSYCKSNNIVESDGIHNYVCPYFFT
jgi:hypothetical protein